MLGSSSIDSRIILYNSMNLQPSDGNLNQVKALHSQDNKSVPPLEQCLFLYTETGWTDCGLYAITYVVDLAQVIIPQTLFMIKVLYAATFHGK